jgi:phage major head subunit gpT-like protein
MATLPAAWGQVLRPGLYSKFGAAYEAHPSLYRQVFEKIASVKAYELLLQMCGLGLLRPRTIGHDAEEDSPTQGLICTIEPSSYSLAMVIPQELVQFDVNGVVSTFPGMLAQAARETEEVLAWNVLNNALAATGWDGTYLGSASHPRVGVSGTWSNLLTKSSLNLAALAAMKTQIRRMTTDRGYRMNMQPDKLLIPPELETTATELLQSMGRPDSANRGINPLQGVATPIVVPWLTSTTGWHVTTKGGGVKNGLVYIDSYGMEQKVTQYDRKRAADHIIHTMQVYSYADPHRVFVNEGA